MGASLDRRDERHADVGYVFQHLSTFVVDLAPNAWVGDVAKRSPVDIRNELPACAGQDYDLVRSILSDAVEGFHKLRVSLRVHSERAAVAVEFSKQHTVGISPQL